MRAAAAASKVERVGALRVDNDVGGFTGVSAGTEAVGNVGDGGRNDDDKTSAGSDVVNLGDLTRLGREGLMPKRTCWLFSLQVETGGMHVAEVVELRTPSS
ncbi:hypothetical protein CF326_g9010 [Tilletia indica]|nr:hypothetical protein CF326_g9010 [Tilletia indica]